jgi:hypothetical protein
MDAGAVTGNPSRYITDPAPHGTPLKNSSLQRGREKWQRHQNYASHILSEESVLLHRVILHPLLFRCDAETVHRQAVAACRVAGFQPLGPARPCQTFTAPELRAEVPGPRRENPVGLAAGWDKSGCEPFLSSV